MKTIVCYGDSNTWGAMSLHECPPATMNSRHPWGVRWTSRIQIELGEEYHVVEAGLCGRTTALDCPMADHRNGLKDIDVTMMCAMPVDMVIIVLGTNDVKDFLNVTPYVSASGVARIIKQIQIGQYGPLGAAPEILVVSPSRIVPAYKDAWLYDEFGDGALEKDARMSEYLRKTAADCGVHFLDMGAYVSADNADGIHMNAESHAVFAEKVIEQIREILK